MSDGDDAQTQQTASGPLNTAGSIREPRNFIGPYHLDNPGTFAESYHLERPGTSGTRLPRSQSPNTIERATLDTSEVRERRSKLETIVNEVRAGQLSRVDAVARILQELESEPWLTSEEKDTTFQLCYTEINEAETPTLGEANRPKVRTAAGTTAPRKANKRTSGDDTDSDSDCEDSPVKKRRLKESEMPWVKASQATAVVSNPSCAETVRLLKLYDNNVKGCKFYVNVASDAPENVPNSQWERIFKGEPINLDQILSSLHRITLDEERKARLGGATISFGAAEPSRKVSTAAEWSAAWRRATRAIAFAFPHRARELDDYGDYIEGEFAAKHTSAHQRIIWYDSAVRNVVRGGQSVLLTDSQRFLNLYSAIVLPDGVQYGRGTSRATRPSSGRGDICRRFNDGVCKSGASCRYKHACLSCNKPGHSQKDCPSSKD